MKFYVYIPWCSDKVDVVVGKYLFGLKPIECITSSRVSNFWLISFGKWMDGSDGKRCLSENRWGWRQVGSVTLFQGFLIFLFLFFCYMFGLQKKIVKIENKVFIQKNISSQIYLLIVTRLLILFIYDSFIFTYINSLKIITF